MTLDQYRREGFRLGIEAAAEACANYPITEPDETEWTYYDEQIAHSQECIRALDVDEVLAGKPPAPDPVARLVAAARALGAMPEGYCFCSADRVGDDSKTHEPECADLRTALAAMETSHALL